MMMPLPGCLLVVCLAAEAVLDAAAAPHPDGGLRSAVAAGGGAGLRDAACMDGRTWVGFKSMMVAVWALQDNGEAGRAWTEMATIVGTGWPAGTMSCRQQEAGWPLRALCLKDRCGRPAAEVC